MTSSRCPMPIWPIKNVQLTNILFVERCNFHYRICPNVSERSRPFPTERYIMCNERITCSVGRDTLIPPRRNLVGLCCACKPSVKLHKTNDLLFPRLFPNTIPKRPQFAAQCQIIPVGIYDQICLVQAELAAFVQQALVHIHGNDFSQKQVVAA